ncbi:hypothetical protein UlMin_019336 [Ulmus minor]
MYITRLQRTRAEEGLDRQLGLEQRRPRLELANLCQGLSLLAILLNCTVSGIAPVANASRADFLTLGLTVTNILAGLVWFSIRPKSLFMVRESISKVTCSRSLVIVYDTSCILQTGFVAESSNTDEKAFLVDTDKLMKRLVCQGVMKSGTQSYLANLSLYPGRSELPFLPLNTQPLGDKGIALVGDDTIRGFTSSDQIIPFNLLVTTISNLLFDRDAFFCGFSSFPGGV